MVRALNDDASWRVPWPCRAFLFDVRGTLGGHVDVFEVHIAAYRGAPGELDGDPFAFKVSRLVLSLGDHSAGGQQVLLRLYVTVLVYPKDRFKAHFFHFEFLDDAVVLGLSLRKAYFFVDALALSQWPLTVL